MSVRDYIAGSLFHFGIGVSPTQGLCPLRFALQVTARDVDTRRGYVLLDVLDVVRQAGLHPLRPMFGSAELWPVPPAGKEIDLDRHSEANGHTWWRVVLEMLYGPSRMNSVALRWVEYSSHWHKGVNGYGLAGIGSMRGKRRFRECHGGLFRQVFPAWSLLALDQEVLPVGPDDYVQISGGKFGVTSGWRCIRSPHSGSRWLGIEPPGDLLEMKKTLDRSRSLGRNAVSCNSMATKLARLLMLRA